MTTTTALDPTQLDRSLCRAATHKLSLRALHTLILLHRERASSLTSLARCLGVTTAAMTQIADSLDAAGLTQRVHSLHDRRTVWLNLTERGQLTLNDILNA